MGQGPVTVSAQLLIMEGELLATGRGSLVGYILRNISTTDGSWSGPVTVSAHFFMTEDVASSITDGEGANRRRQVNKKVQPRRAAPSVFPL